MGTSRNGGTEHHGGESEDQSESYSSSENDSGSESHSPDETQGLVVEQSRGEDQGRRLEDQVSSPVEDRDGGQVDDDIEDDIEDDAEDDIEDKVEVEDQVERRGRGRVVEDRGQVESPGGGDQSWRPAAEEGQARIRAVRTLYRDQALARIRADFLADIRRAQQLTRAQVAERMGVSQVSVARLENDGMERTDVATLRAYVGALGGRIEVSADFGYRRIILG